MKDRLTQIVKWFLIILGLLFLFQIIVVCLAIFGISRLDTINFDMPSMKKPKEVQNVINYVEKYKSDNEAYPETLDGLKLDDKFNYKYELSKDKNCYTIEIKSKDEKTTKNYRHCKTEDGANYSNTESYSEIKN